MAYDLTNKTAQQILDFFRRLDTKEGENFEIELLEADIERIGYKAFVDLAQIFSLKLLTHTKKADSAILSFYKLKKENSFHNEEKGVEKYGTQSQFFQIDKTSQFSFLYYYQEALSFIDIKSKKRVLNLGVNRGDEFRVIKEMLGNDTFKAIEFIGVDYSSSAIEYAKADFFEDKNVEFICYDINNLNELNIGKFDLIISIGTLQSSNIEFNTAFMSIYQNHLAHGGAIVLGFPNCRWVDTEMLYGAKAPNYSFSELSLVLKDIHFCKKYLQQKKYRVVVTGKDYLFLSARKIAAL